MIKIALTVSLLIIMSASGAISEDIRPTIRFDKPNGRVIEMLNLSQAKGCLRASSTGRVGRGRYEHGALHGFEFTYDKFGSSYINLPSPSEIVPALRQRVVAAFGELFVEGNQLAVTTLAEEWPRWPERAPA